MQLLESVVDDEELDELEALRSQPWAYEESDNSTISERYGAVSPISAPQSVKPLPRGSVHAPLMCPLL